MKTNTFLFSATLEQLFVPVTDSNIKSLLIDSFGQNLPSRIINNKNNVLCDKSLINYIVGMEHDEYGTIAHYCVVSYGLTDSIYSWDKLTKAISELTFVNTHKATPWTDDNHDNFYAINRKKLKKWFKQNHNRFLQKKTTKVKLKLSDCY